MEEKSFVVILTILPNFRDIGEYMKSMVNDGTSGDNQAQMDCYGFGERC